MNGDGIDDIAVAAPGLRTVYLLFGDKHGEAQLGKYDGAGAKKLALEEEARRLFGESQGFYNNGIRGGVTGRMVQILKSAGDGLNATAGDFDGDAFGETLAGGGDVNGDGFDDLVIGAPKSDGGEGKVYVIYGGPTHRLCKSENVHFNPRETRRFSYRGERFDHNVTAEGLETWNTA